MLVTYGSRVVTAGATSDPYGLKYKGIWICLELLKRGLAGNYVNFGVFELYGDPALKVFLSPCSYLARACARLKSKRTLITSSAAS